MLRVSMTGGRKWMWDVDATSTLEVACIGTSSDPEGPFRKVHYILELTS